MLIEWLVLVLRLAMSVTMTPPGYDQPSGANFVGGYQSKWIAGFSSDIVGLFLAVSTYKPLVNGIGVLVPATNAVTSVFGPFNKVVGVSASIAKEGEPIEVLTDGMFEVTVEPGQRVFIGQVLQVSSNGDTPGSTAAGDNSVYDTKNLAVALSSAKGTPDGESKVLALFIKN
eukprot:gb/GEZN01010139.1/.p1 GENE.gb/GEZN01010139.1/~~gb/GEZN01010139.1/.p1  ORF type:complete len:172 (-),score=14.75 gb/GEZN01010139.1/:426-941(-)